MTPYQKMLALTLVPACLIIAGIWGYIMWDDHKDSKKMRTINYKMNEFMYDKMKVSDMEVP